MRQEMPTRVAFRMHLMETRLSTLQSSVDQALLRWHHEEVPTRRHD
jgi:hypothetical protein